MIMLAIYLDPRRKEGKVKYEKSLISGLIPNDIFESKKKLYVGSCDEILGSRHQLT